MKELQGKTVAVLIEEQYHEIEAWVPYYRLKEAGARVFMVGREKGQVCHGKYGYPAVAETDYASLMSSALDAVIIPGGFAPDFMRRYPEPARLVAETFRAGKVVAAICHGAWILASAGILKDRGATCFYAIADDIKNAGAYYRDAEVVVDGNLITSRKPEDLPVFCGEIVKALLRTPA